MIVCVPTAASQDIRQTVVNRTRIATQDAVTATRLYIQQQPVGLPRENGQKAPSTLATAQSESQAEMRLQAKETPSPVSFVGVVKDEDVVATTKRTAEGEPLPTQPRSDGPQTISELTRTAIQPTLRSPSVPNIGETQQKMLRTYGVPKTAKKPRNKRKKRKSKKKSIQEHVGKYNVITEFANAPAGVTFGQLIR